MEILDQNQMQSQREQLLGRRFVFQQHNNAKLTTKATYKWFQNKSVSRNILTCDWEEP